jgi:hypothetical protein
MPGQNLLLVEGKDDEHVLYALLKHHRIPERFKVVNKEGIDNLLETLPVELKRSDLERLGIVVDANTDLAARWTAVRNILLEAGAVNVPRTPSPEGSVAILEQPDRTLTVGIWLMPDNQLPGMLENFIAFLVPPNDPLWDYAGDCLRRIPQPRFSPAHLPKVHIHTWLAWQEEPGTPMGLAITKRYLDAHAPNVHRLMAWIRRVFDV